MEMRSILSYVFLFFVVVTFSACEKKEANIVYDRKYIDEIKEVRTEFAAYLMRSFIPGGEITIAKKGKIVYSEGFGLASKNLDVPMKRDNKLRIAAISELFTSFIYLKMVEEGILIPDSSVQHYIPDYPMEYGRINLQHLVHHTSGIRTPTMLEKESKEFNVSIARGLEVFKNDELLSPPGYFQDISMYNYNLLGAVMEKASGKIFPDLLKEYVTDTLNLENTVVDNPFNTIKGRADFYDYNFIAQSVHASTRDFRFGAPSIGVLSSAEDIAKFIMAILKSDYVSDDFRKKLFEEIKLEDGNVTGLANGWIHILNGPADIIYGRAGEVIGGGAAVVVFPEDELILACAVNATNDLGGFNFFDLASKFFDNQKDNSEQIPNKEEKETE